MHHPINRIAYTTAFVIAVVEHWLEWKIIHYVHHEWSIQWPITPWADALPRSCILYIIICYIIIIIIIIIIAVAAVVINNNFPFCYLDCSFTNS